MSFIISNKQYLAPTESKAQYEPIVFEEEGLEVERMDVNFGHPLYTSVVDIIYVKSTISEDRPFPIVPDGCVTLVFHGNQKSEDEEVDSYICGVTDEIKKIIIKPYDYYVFIRFQPGTGYSLIRGNAGLITNKSVPVKGNMICDDEILSIIERKTHLDGRIRLISKEIRVHLHNEPNKYLIKYCTEKIFETQGNIKVEKLAEETGFTSRHVGKMFEKCVGVSPKLYSQIMRLQLSMKKILQDKEKLLVEIAMDSGFFDHAHMNRMYKKFIHCSSGDFRDKVLSNLKFDEIEDYIS